MLFNSLAFSVFFPVVAVLYFLLEQRFRGPLLLLASCYFYMFFIPRYILILALTILVDYFAAIYIEDHEGPARRRALVISIISTCLILGIFKYCNFFIENVHAALEALGFHPSLHALRITLPIGLSFHTFQSLSYVIEVYEGRQKCERDFGVYALYVMFFPQLVAGPIERPQNLLHQFHERHSFDAARAGSGLMAIAEGLFLKVVVADRLAVFVNSAYEDPASASGARLALATVFFAFQIYCDFAGYSRIAIGSARVLGIELMRNFRRPYLSRSVAEFWSRWHISLSTWFRDYLYIPLGGSRVPFIRWQLNLLATFLVSGLWHGANWTFVIWGALNGLYLIGENMVGANTPRLPAPLARLRTFALIGFSWIFFRAESLASATLVVRRIMSWSPGRTAFDAPVLCGCAIIVALCILEYLEEKRDLSARLAAAPAFARMAYANVLIAALFAFGVYGQNRFIYFQF